MFGEENLGKGTNEGENPAPHCKVRVGDTHKKQESSVSWTSGVTCDATKNQSFLCPPPLHMSSPNDKDLATKVSTSEGTIGSPRISFHLPKRRASSSNIGPGQPAYQLILPKEEHSISPWPPEKQIIKESKRSAEDDQPQYAHKDFD